MTTERYPLWLHRDEQGRIEECTPNTPGARRIVAMGHERDKLGGPARREVLAKLWGLAESDGCFGLEQNFGTEEQ